MTQPLLRVISKASLTYPTFFTLDHFRDIEIFSDKNSPIIGVILDLDGTILNSMPWWENLGERYLIERGRIPAHDIREHFKRLTLFESACYMHDVYQLSESPQDIAHALLDSISNAYRTSMPAKPGAVEFVRFLFTNGIPCCVATASEREVCEAALQRLGILNIFEDIFIASELSTNKTRPDIFLAAQQRLGTPIARTLVIEDSLHALRTAHNAGFLTAAICEPYAREDEEAIRGISCAFLRSFYLSTP